MEADASAGAQEEAAVQGRMGRPVYIGPLGLRQLRAYKYQGVDHSLLSRFLLQPFWSRFVLLIPTSVAPNAVTLAGFACVVLSYACSWCLAPRLDQPLPWWICVFFAVLLFVYQTLDAVDGKQARRTNSSSPLGEFFDHGCDALVATMEALPFAAALQLGASRAVVAWFCSSSTFFMATWENFHTHTLRLPIMNGPTEGLALIYTMFLLISVSGPEAWHKPVPLPPFLKRILHAGGVGLGSPVLIDVLLVLFILLGVIPTIISNVRIVVAQGEQAHVTLGDAGPGSCSKASSTSSSSTSVAHGEGRGTTPTMLQLALPYWVLVAFTALGVLLPLEQSQPHAFFLPVTFSLGLMAGHLILAHLTGEVDSLLWSMWQPLVLQPLVLLNGILERSDLPHLPPSYPFAALLLHTGGLYASFIHGVTSEMCRHLNIRCFSLGKRKAL